MDLTALKETVRTTLALNLNCQGGCRIALVADPTPFDRPEPELPDRAALAELFAEEALALGAKPFVILYPPTGAHGSEPPTDAYRAVYPPAFCEYADRHSLWTALLAKSLDPEARAELVNILREEKPRFDALLGLTKYSFSHTQFRQMLCESGVRAATMPRVELTMFSGVMRANWSEVSRRSTAVAEALSRAMTAVIRSGGGRVLTFSLEGRSGIADTGILTQPGAFGNLPGGEGFIAPVEGTASGSVCVGPGSNPEAGVFVFEQGRMLEIEGDVPRRAVLGDIFAHHPEARNLAELGVGTNERAEDPTNILEAEKILGTVHLALGDNSTFGGTVRVPFHDDFVVFRPTLILVDAEGDERMILDDGHLTVE